MRYRASDAPQGLSAAHDEIVKVSRVRVPWTWLRHAELSSGCGRRLVSRETWSRCVERACSISWCAGTRVCAMTSIPWPGGQHCLPCVALEAHRRGRQRLAFKARRSPNEGTV